MVAVVSEAGCVDIEKTRAIRLGANLISMLGHAMFVGVRLVRWRHVTAATFLSSRSIWRRPESVARD